MSDTSMIFLLITAGLLGSLSVVNAVKYAIKDNVGFLIFSVVYAELAMLFVAFVVIGVR